MTEYIVKHYNIELSEVKKNSRCLTAWNIKVKMHEETLVGILKSFRHIYDIQDNIVWRYMY